MTNSLATFGDRDDIREIGERLQKMMPGTESFTQAEALTVAQIAVAHGLDPFNGEVWGIKGKGKWYGVMVGIKGLRKSARRQMKDVDGSYWTKFIPVQPEKYGVTAKDAVVYECIIRDTYTNNAWAKSLKDLRDAGVPYDDVIEMLGSAPSVTGIGVADPSERSKMDLHARAKKRAEADAIKQRFDVEFAGANYSPEYVDYEPEVTVPTIEPVSRDERDSSEILRELGYEVDVNPVIVDAVIVEDPGRQDEQDDLRMFKSTTKQAIVDKGYAENLFAAAGMLDHSNLPGDVSDGIAVAWARNYRGAREDGKTTPEAAELANSAYTDYLANS